MSPFTKTNHSSQEHIFYRSLYADTLLKYFKNARKSNLEMN